MGDIGDINHETNVLVRRLELDLEDKNITKREIKVQQEKAAQQSRRYDVELMKIDIEIRRLENELKLHKQKLEGINNG